MPCSASPMPATLPWPKIAQTPSMKRSPSSVICTLSQRIIACAAVSRMRSAHRFPSLCVLRAHATASRAVARALSQMRAEPGVALGHLRHRRVVVGLAGHPAPRHLAEDRPADGEALDEVEAGGGLEARRELGFRRVEAEHHDAAGVGVVLLDRGDRVRPGGARGHRLELPPVGPDAGGVELADQRRGGVVVDRADLGGDDLEQELEPVAARGFPEPLDRRLLFVPHLGRVVRVAEAEHLDHVLPRPLVQAAEVAAELGLQRQRPRSRPFAGAADPEAGAARRRAAPRGRAGCRRGCRSRGGRPAPRARPGGRAA